MYSFIASGYFGYPPDVAGSYEGPVTRQHRACELKYMHINESHTHPEQAQKESGVNSTNKNSQPLLHRNIYGLLASTKYHQTLHMNVSLDCSRPLLRSKLIRIALTPHLFC